MTLLPRWPEQVNLEDKRADKMLNSAGEHWEENPSSLMILCPLQPKSANLPGLYTIIQLLHSKQQHLNRPHSFASPFWGAEQTFTSHFYWNEIPLCQWKSESQRQQTHIILWERAEKNSKQKGAKNFLFIHNWWPRISYTNPSQRTGICPSWHPDPTEEIKGKSTQLVLHFLFNTNCGSKTETHSRPYCTAISLVCEIWVSIFLQEQPQCKH